MLEVEAGTAAPGVVSLDPELVTSVCSEGVASVPAEPCFFDFFFLMFSSSPSVPGFCTASSRLLRRLDFLRVFELACARCATVAALFASPMACWRARWMSSGNEVTGALEVMLGSRIEWNAFVDGLGWARRVDEGRQVRVKRPYSSRPVPNRKVVAEIRFPSSAHVNARPTVLFNADKSNIP